ncbi:hypothetical protein PsorP6_008945 [Peronosclerospora sorghi]|uniref:Uncharacterized protein n=1 Tax=Peronosclerospora sorghi TaxID=230839 RepID=A0ACC0W207_9STRA|nr:hypothetical protein PsorP6_008945 [Peronosclerospora sorghi]
MWNFLEHAAKTASVNASSYVNTVQEKAQTLASAVQDEASLLLKSAMESTRSGPVDDILYEEVTAYEEFSRAFSIEKYRHEINFLVDTEDEVHELLDALVPLELSYVEFWRRYFFRNQRIEQDPDQLLNTKTLDDKIDEESEKAIALDGEDEHGNVMSPSFVARERREKSKTEDQERICLLQEARDAERRAAVQWQEKAKELHRQLQETKQKYDEREQITIKKWEEQLQSLCDTYEIKMAEATLQIDEARAAGYEEGVRESQVIVESVRQKAKEDVERVRKEVEDGAIKALGDEKVAVLTKEIEELQQKLQAAQLKLEKQGGLSTEDAAIAELTKEKDMWRMRALKMKKLKDLVQTELTTLRDQRDADRVVTSASSDSVVNSYDVSTLQVRMNELQTQLANALADSEARARRAYEEGIEKRQFDAESQWKQKQDVAFQEGYKKAQAEAKSEMGVLKTELKMFRASHQSAAENADRADGSGVEILDTSQGDISLDDGQALCSPTSSTSILTDNAKTDLSLPEFPKSSDDWGEW